MNTCRERLVAFDSARPEVLLLIRLTKSDLRGRVECQTTVMEAGVFRLCYDK